MDNATPSGGSDEKKSDLLQAANVDLPSVAVFARTHDKGSATEEPCAGKLASTVLKQR